MTELTYEVVRHDDGWAYKVGNVFSETFATHEAARHAARAAAVRQQQASEPTEIEYEDERGEWHSERTSGHEHPGASVVDRD
jgi:hypothetical protein